MAILFAQALEFVKCLAIWRNFNVRSQQWVHCVVQFPVLTICCFPIGRLLSVG